MRLYLVQHGDAVAKDVDPDRPLSQDGRDDVAEVAAHLAGRVPPPLRVAHSGKTRAQQTADILASQLASGSVVEAVTGLAPLDDVEPWVKEVAGWTQDTALVGHQPFMGRLVSRLVSGRASTDVFDYQPGSVVCLERDDQSVWRIVWALRPELVRE